MHGRLKIKTTAQQEAEKKAEREKKKCAYQASIKAVLDARAAGQNDDQQLRVTGGLLVANPDITTLWNIRREVILHNT